MRALTPTRPAARPGAVRVAVPLSPPTARAMPWPALLGALALGLLIVAVPAGTGLELGRSELVNLLRVAAGCAGIGVAFLLDDPTTQTTAVVPVSRLTRHAVRLVLVLPVLALWWAAALVVTVEGAEPGVGPLGALRGVTVEAAVIVAVGVGVAALALRRVADGGAGVVAAPALLVLVAVATALPGRAQPFVDPADPRWNAVHRGWLVALGCAVLVAAAASRERRR